MTYTRGGQIWTLITPETCSLLHAILQQGGSAEGTGIEARNVALSGLNAAAFQIITKFEAYGFTDEIGHLLTNNLDFIDLVKQATTQTTSTAVINEEGQRKQHKAPVLTDKGWHVPN